MFACPNCGGNLKFHIPTQQLLCEFCNSQFDPYSFDNKESDATEQQFFETTIFSCPQCGGELLSTDNSAAAFCSFCGASTVLYSRIHKEKRPGYIIPFQKTKEDCKQAYGNFMKHAVFAPKELKDPAFIDGFRGIYMPYWAFYITQQGTFSLSAEKKYRRNDYIITDHYKLTGDLDCYYKGLSYDASSSFDDNISEALAPYDVKGMKAFTPAYFSGFYADTSDVPPEEYQGDAEYIAMSETFQRLSDSNAFRDYTIKSSPVPNKEDALLHTKTESVDTAMFPVWFMSYRNKDRVCYATVNGQTGKVVCDLPVDIRKYLLGSAILSIPIFFLLNFILTLLPSTLLSICGFLSLVACIISVTEISSIAKREPQEEEKGVFRQWFLPFSIVFGLGSLLFSILYGVLGSFGGTRITSILWSILSLGTFVTGMISLKKAKHLPKDHKRLFGLCFNLMVILCSNILMVFHPASDIYYYTAAILLLVSICLMLTDIIRYYNLLATRRLPQFEKTGGDDRA